MVDDAGVVLAVVLGELVLATALGEAPHAPNTKARAPRSLSMRNRRSTRTFSPNVVSPLTLGIPSLRLARKASDVGTALTSPPWPKATGPGRVPEGR